MHFSTCYHSETGEFFAFIFVSANLADNFTSLADQKRSESNPLVHLETDYTLGAQFVEAVNYTRFTYARFPGNTPLEVVMGEWRLTMESLQHLRLVSTADEFRFF